MLLSDEAAPTDAPAAFGALEAISRSAAVDAAADRERLRLALEESSAQSAAAVALSTTELRAIRAGVTELVAAAPPAGEVAALLGAIRSLHAAARASARKQRLQWAIANCHRRAFLHLTAVVTETSGRPGLVPMVLASFMADERKGVRLPPLTEGTQDSAQHEKETLFHMALCSLLASLVGVSFSVGPYTEGAPCVYMDEGPEDEQCGN